MIAANDRLVSAVKANLLIQMPINSMILWINEFNNSETRFYVHILDIYIVCSEGQTGAG